LITLPNLPVFASGGNWSIAPGALGYEIVICLAAGSAQTTPANDVWQNGAFVGAIGQDNFAAKPVNSTFVLFFVQHEPGALCTTPIDCPFQQNLDDCLRYFDKSYPYGTAIGAVITNGAANATFPAGYHPWLYVPFKKTMAKTPTIAGYSPATGAVNTVRDVTASADKTITAAVAVGDHSFSGFSISGANAAAWQGQFHYTTDTGW
jgi:hypothetical protein